MIKKKTFLKDLTVILVNTAIGISANATEVNIEGHIRPNKLNIENVSRAYPIKIENILPVKPEIKYSLLEKSLQDISKDIPLNKEEQNKLLDYAFKEIKVPDYVDKEYIRALIETESSWIPTRISKRGARGLGQFMEGTWYDHMPEVPFSGGAFDSKLNIKAVLMQINAQENYLTTNFSQWDSLTIEQKLDYQSAAYNLGLGKLKKNNWDIEDKIPRETKNHILRVRSRHERYSSSI